MPTPAEVTADLTSKIASLLAAEKGTFTVSGSLPIASDRESAASSQSTQCNPITVRWDPTSAPAGESRNMIFPPAPAAESTGRGLDQLEALLRDCQPATFGRGGEDILDETYRKALKLDSSMFSSDLCPYELGIVDTVAELLMPSKYMAGGTHGVKADLYKLNIYSGPSGHFKAHVDTPRSDSQFGSLVICLPCAHSGGALSVRHNGQEVTYDWGASTGLNKPNTTPALQWAAFYSDCEHEVFEVTSGHRVTLTYNLYAVPDRQTNLTQGMEVARLPLYKVVQEAIANPLFMPEGGHLGFYCLHAYPHSSKAPYDAPLFPSILKGVDLFLYSVLRALNLEVNMCRVLQDIMDDDYNNLPTDEPEDAYYEEMKTTRSHLRNKMDGVVVTEAGGYDASTEEILQVFGNPVRVKWLNEPVAEQQGQQGYVHLTYGNEAGINALYTYASLIVELPSKAARRGVKRECVGN